MRKKPSVMLQTADGYGILESRMVRLFRRCGENYNYWTPTTPTEEAGRRIPVGWWKYVDSAGRMIRE